MAPHGGDVERAPLLRMLEEELAAADALSNRLPAQRRRLLQVRARAGVRAAPAPCMDACAALLDAPLPRARAAAPAMRAPRVPRAATFGQRGASWLCAAAADARDRSACATQLTVGGMTCGSCSGAVERALRAVPGACCRWVPAPPHGASPPARHAGGARARLIAHQTHNRGRSPPATAAASGATHANAAP
jgi:hypothetical protein